MRVALTFDAEHAGWPNPSDVCTRILETLLEHDARATFFIQGRWAAAYPELARRIARDGHLIGNHTHHHAPLMRMTNAGIAEELEQAERTIFQITGANPKPWMRCPFISGHQDNRVRTAIADTGYQSIAWDVDSGDWDELGTDEIAPPVIARLRDRAIVLFHTWPARTAYALPAILGRPGLECVGLDEL